MYTQSPSPSLATRLVRGSLLLVIWLGLLLIPVAAQAQAPLTLESLAIQVWPEYDQPATLVIVDGDLPAGTALPVSLNLRIPAGAGEPHAVAVRTATGELLTAGYTTAPAGDDIIISFTTDQLGFRVEYYDAARTVTGDRHAVTFRFTSDYAVTAAAVRVQQPATATGLSGSPALDALGVGADGLSYFEHAFGPLAAGGSLTLEINYTKTDDALTAQALGLDLPVEAGDPALAHQNLPWVIGASVATVGVLAVGGTIYLLRRRNQSLRRRHHRGGSRRSAAASAPASPRHRKGRRRTVAAAAEAPVQAFCTRCGHRLEAADQFCRRCGEPVMARP